MPHGHKCIGNSDSYLASQVIVATNDDPVDVKLEAVTEKTTRMTVKIGEGLKKDRATAQEIVDQTKRALGEGK